MRLLVVGLLGFKITDYHIQESIDDRTRLACQLLDHFKLAQQLHIFSVATSSVSRLTATVILPSAD